MLHMCLFQRYNCIPTIKVLKGQVSLLRGLNSNVSWYKYERVGPARAEVLSLCWVLIERTG